MYIDKNTSLLDKRVNKTSIEQSSNKETMLMLSAPERKDEIEILKKIGLSSHIEKVEAALNDVNRLKIVSDKFGRKTYYGHQIKDLCFEYDLKMLRADNFKGRLPVEIGQSLLDFIKESTFTQEKSETRTIEKTNLDIVESSFFIVTTKKSFQGSKMESATLFYREGGGHYNSAGESEVFVEVVSWGKPYTNNLGEAFTDIFVDKKEFNWNLGTFILLGVSFIISLFKDVSFSYWWVFLYITSCLILLFSTFNNKKSLWNQIEN